MLKYEIKLTDDSFRQEELVWSEKYLAPDLSFVTGVTSQSYHLEKFNKLPLSNSMINNSYSIAELETENAKREGYIVIKNKRYEVNSGSVVDYSVESSGSVTNYDYLFLNGKYYYSYNNSGFTIDNWLSGTTNGVVTTSVKVSGSSAVTIDTVAWIEDGIVSVDGYNYIFDKEEQIDANTIGGLKYSEDGECLPYSAITYCDGIEYHIFPSSALSTDVSTFTPSGITSATTYVTKFKLTKEEEIAEPFDRISFCKYFYYVNYKNHYLPIVLSGDTTQYFKCEIPNYVLGKVIDKEDPTYYKVEYFDVYYQKNGELENSEILKEPLSGNTFEDIKNVESFVIIDKEIFYVDNDIMNANDGREIAIYLENKITNIAVGDKLRVVDSSDTNHLQQVYSVDDYGFNKNDDTNFVLFNGKKYKVEPNLCDKVLINGNEYSIDYINGKITSADCLVTIGDEEVPMKIKSVDKLERYGKIISGASNSAITATYNIKPYSGITVDNRKYIITEEGKDGDKPIYYAHLDRSNEYTFIVERIVGSSMVVCVPDINVTDFTDDFNVFIAKEICNDVVENQSEMTLYTKNKVFGVNEITQELAFQNYTKPISSDDYYNLFDNLEVFTKNAYIHIPLLLNSQQGNNLLQDDIVESQFFEQKKKEAINPIVDMEKDVYIPKFMSGNVYSGSTTVFEPIKQIKVNLHFRTRDSMSWKINEGYNNKASSGDTDNWFITDMNPYRRIIEDGANTHLYEYNNNGSRIVEVPRNRALNILHNTSDLVGLLNFTDDDVYYQKSKLAKSFLRFSYYDSTNPQTQTLLATSTVFMDEHRLFKKFIDNSRKNINDYGLVEPVEYRISADTGQYAVDNNGIPIDIASGSTIRKVSVMSEYLGSRKINRNTYLQRNNRYVTNFDGVIIDEEHRIGADFIIDNKIATNTSSEGFYLYIFREYSENLHPKPIYMKVEFNHAGIGKTIPFLIPMKWSEPDADSNRTPISALTFNDSDLSLLKQGIKLEDVYAQTYIPLYAVYDFNNKEYSYVFDDRYVTIGEDNVATLNLFELKVQNEEGNVTEQIQKEITMKKQKTAIVDINRNQFPQHEGVCNN